ncbi:hypothetical protein BT96DRAFT_981205 [Gymnopus androsaceus JB14]|uniref:Uncharacterized protein n=1 Tax=Gymnopus androsaceus JB14 TaxID=1447944 RepID=A0A6A4GRB0_9AGAR|nr:hypothetical protein BT96DRAFT_981205 [Gymnopus androsaceus JB14]
MGASMLKHVGGNLTDLELMNVYPQKQYFNLIHLGYTQNLKTLKLSNINQSGWQSPAPWVVSLFVPILISDQNMYPPLILQHLTIPVTFNPTVALKFHPCQNGLQAMISLHLEPKCHEIMAFSFLDPGWIQHVYQVVQLCMTGRKPSPSTKPISSSKERATCALRLHSLVVGTPQIQTPTFTPAVESVSKAEGHNDHNSPNSISKTPTPNSAIVSLPPSHSHSSHSTSSNDMSPNLSGTGFVNMGSTKTGCQLLVAHLMLKALEEYWDYLTINHNERSITDDAVKKKEFI